MSSLLFELKGEMALWRNVYDSMGTFSCLGPAPSHLAGLCGAALGFAAPRSQAAENPEENKLKSSMKAGLPWPVSEELLQWEQTEHIQFACAWTGQQIRRGPWNMNGLKEIKKGENLRIQQQVIFAPSYLVAVRADREETLEKLADALRSPTFPVFLGTSFCRAIVTNIRLEETLPEADWAFRVKSAAFGESVPFSLHRLDAMTSGNRMAIDGYWVYPTALYPGEKIENPFVNAYC